MSLDDLLGSENPNVVALGELITPAELLNARANLTNQGIALANSQQAESLALSAANRATNAANAAEDLGLNRERLFFNSGINYRNISNQFGTAGLGDSGFANRARREFNTDRNLSDQELQLAFKKQIDAINQQAAGQALSANQAADNQRLGLEGQQLSIQEARLSLADIAAGVLSTQGEVTGGVG